MTHDLLDVSRISAGEKIQLNLETCDLYELVLKTVDVLVAIHGDRFKLSGLRQCNGLIEPKSIRRVIENLCSNAVKYGDSAAPIELALKRTKTKIFLSVHNEGPPIPIDDQKSLFNPFHRTASARKSGKNGWGIGLTLVRGICESHGGGINLESGEGKGTTFTIELPLGG